MNLFDKGVILVISSNLISTKIFIQVIYYSRTKSYFNYKFKTSTNIAIHHKNPAQKLLIKYSTYSSY
ncbi:hypothetical protein QUF74_18595, partial [Candidatus Halobeggiatoa sp. HSG11]|nr:hypothetical protein [Candidatus Halobeggiatoa sp. HSG11]